MSDNSGKSVWTVTPVRRLYYEERFGRNWRESAFLGTFTLQPHDTPITNIPLLFMLADKSEQGVYSPPAFDFSSPVDDWFVPLYDWGTFTLLDYGQFETKTFGVIHHELRGDEKYNLSFVPVSGKTASAQGWETFDTFIEDPETAKGDLVGFDIVPDQQIWAFGYAFSTMENVQFWDDPAEYADALIYYKVRTSGVWGDPVELPISDFVFTAGANDDKIAFGVTVDRTINGGYGTGIVLRVGSDIPQQ